MKPAQALTQASRIPLSCLQKEIWVNQMLHPDVPLFNVGGYACIDGKLNISLFKQALTHVIDMHDALRIRLHEGKEFPQQSVLERGLAEQTDRLLDIKDFTGNEQVALERIQQQHSQPFTLNDSALCHFTVYKVADNRYFWYTKYHYLIADGKTMALVVQDVSASYNALLNSNPLPGNPSGYSDYVAADLGYLESTQYTADLAYWREKYKQLPEALLPAQHVNNFAPGAVIPSKRTTLNLPRELFVRLEALSSAENVPVGEVLLGLLYTYFSRIKQQDDCVIGMINLTHREINQQAFSFERTAGFFLNVIPVRFTVGTDTSFRHLLQALHQQLQEDTAHSRLTLGEINREAKVNRENRQRSQLFELELAYIDFDCDVTLGTSPLRFHLLTHGHEQYALTLYIERFHTDGAVTVHFDYNCAYFNSAEMRLLAGRFEYLLKQVLEQPDKNLAELTLMPADERNQVLGLFNAVDQAIPYQKRGIHQLFEAQVARTPEATAIMFAGQYLSYCELNKRANQLAHHLQSLGVTPDTLVGICVERSLEMIIGLLAILKAGGAYVPLDPAYPQERLAFMLEDSAVPILLTQKKWLATLAVNQAHVLCLDQDWEQVAHYSQDNPHSKVTADNLAYVIYTSGSTGNPKGVLIQHGGLCNLATDNARCYKLGKGSRVVQFISLSFDPATADIFMTLCAGAALYLPPPAQQALETGLVDFLHEHAITHMQIPPAVLASLPTDVALPALQVIGSGGETPNLNMVQHWAAGRRYFNLYGPTETTVTATLMEFQEGMTLFPIGKPIANTQVYVLDKNNQPTPIGVTGDMYIGGAGVAGGYLNRPELTAERFVSNPFSDDPAARLYKTGDLARYLPDGNLEFIGREDNQIKIRGFRVELGEVEQAISQQAEIKENTVVLHESVAHGKRLVVYLIPHLSTQAEQEHVADKLRESLKKTLPEHMIPTAFVVLDAFPLTPNGKVDRHALEQYEVDYQATAEFTAPRNDQEQQLADCWMQALGLEQVGVHHNFFELGGDSLSGIQLVALLQQRFKQSFQLADLFRQPTIAEFTALLATTNSLDSQIITPVSDHQALLPLSFSQEEIWLNNRQKPGDTSYNICTVFSLHGSLQPTLLQQSFNTIMRRHSILRTCFQQHDRQIAPAQVVQTIKENVPLDIQIEHADHLQTCEQNAEIVRLLTAEENQPFDLEHAPLWRLRLIHFSTDKHALIISFHHSIEDAWSLQILLKELSTLYAAFASGKPSPLEPLKIQYADFAAWQRHFYTPEVLQARYQYWRSLLSEKPCQLRLPVDHSYTPSATRQTYRSAMQTYSLSATLTQQLRQLGRQQGSSLPMVLLSAYFTMLHHYSGQNDLVVGMPTTKRNQHQVEPLMGYFSGMSVLRVKLPPQANFTDVLTLVQHSVQETMENQDLTLKQVWNGLQLPWTGQENLLFRTVFNFIPVPRKTIEMADITVEPMGLKREKMVRDLVFGLWDKDGSGAALEGFIRYREDLFAANTIVQMVEQFQQLLNRIVEQPNQIIDDLLTAD